MKFCPNCNQTYTDESLNFCLNDGATLTQLKTDEPPPTIQMNAARTTSPNFTEQPNFTNQTNFGENAPLSNWQSQSPVTPNQSPFMPPPMMNRVGQNQTLPTVSLVLGVLGLLLFCCYGGFIFGIPAIITGFLGMNNANNNPAQYSGRGLAIAGMICGGLSLLGALMMILLAILGNL